LTIWLSNQDVLVRGMFHDSMVDSWPPICQATTLGKLFIPNWYRPKLWCKQADSVMDISRIWVSVSNPWSHCISWCLAESYKNRDQHSPMALYGLGRTSHFYICWQRWLSFPELLQVVPLSQKRNLTGEDIHCDVLRLISLLKYCEYKQHTNTTIFK